MGVLTDCHLCCVSIDDLQVNRSDFHDGRHNRGLADHRPPHGASSPYSILISCLWWLFPLRRPLTASTELFGTGNRAKHHAFPGRCDHGTLRHVCVPRTRSTGSCQFCRVKHASQTSTERPFRPVSSTHNCCQPFHVRMFHVTSYHHNGFLITASSFWPFLHCRAAQFTNLKQSTSSCSRPSRHPSVQYPQGPVFTSKDGFPVRESTSTQHWWTQTLCLPLPRASPFFDTQQRPHSRVFLSSDQKPRLGSSVSPTLAHVQSEDT